MLIISDLDGTLANLEYRRDFVETEPKNWTAFNNSVEQDKPIWPIIITLQGLWNVGHDIIICSGRNENTRKVTENWLRSFDVLWDELLMRKENDYRDDVLVKKEMLEYIRDEYGEPSLVFDDRQKVVDMWRQEGIICAQVDYGNF